MPTALQYAESLREEMRLQLAQLQQNDSEIAGSVSDAFDRVITVLDTIHQGMTVAVASQQYTTTGLAERYRTLSEPRLTLVEQLRRDADRVRRGFTNDIDREWEALQRPPATADERALIADRTARLEATDPAIREAYLRIAGQSGEHNELLKAVLLYPRPPIEIDGATWKPLVSDTFLGELRTIVGNRVNPFGPRALYVQILEHLAARLEAMTEW